MMITLFKVESLNLIEFQLLNNLKENNDKHLGVCANAFISYIYTRCFYEKHSYDY